MSILTAQRVGQSFGAYDVFSGISVTVPNDGKVGLVGPNGVGKTTLLLILASLSQPSSGKVTMSRGARLGYLSQESSDAFIGRNHSVFAEMLTVFSGLDETARQLRAMEAAMSSGEISEELLSNYSALQDEFELAGGYDYDLRIRQVLTGMGFTPETWELPLEYLSGGQKTRALLARLLLEKPDLLILDEPTNHLDVEAIQWLESTLRLWEGAVVIVSHDRYFLDTVVNTIWEMSLTGIENYRGNYSAYLQQRTDRWERRQKEYSALMERLEQEMDFIRRNISGQRTQMAQGKLSRLAREVEVIHSGGMDVLGTLKSKGWMQVKEEVGLEGRPASTVGELQQRINELRPPKQPQFLRLTMRASHRSGNIVLRTSDLKVGYPGNTLFTADNIELHRLECAALIGPNGSGKTTFLRTILEQLPPIAGEVHLGASLKVGYFAQAHDEMDPEKTVLDEFFSHQMMPISEARSFLARFLFRGDEVYNKVSTLSGGERSRLALAILALQDANFLLLDEPTNHLDIPAQETLQAAMEDFGGTILLVSHDRYLINRLATQIWELRDGRLIVYGMGYQDYLVQLAQETMVEKDLSKANGANSSNEEYSEGNIPSKNALRRMAEELQALEDRIHEAETRLAFLSETLQEASRRQDVSEIKRLSREYGETETALADLMAAWELAHEA